MQILTLPLRADAPLVHLDAYLLHNSSEYHTNQKRPAVIICPGGGYDFTTDREAEPVALRFLARGYHAFVLRYSVQTHFPQPMHDLAAAISMLRTRSDDWLIDPGRVSVCGFSAGGHLAASLGVMWHEAWLSEPLGVRPEHVRPDTLILGYPAIDLDLIDNRPVLPRPEGSLIGHRDLVHGHVLATSEPGLKAQYQLDRHVSSLTPPTFLWHTAEDPVVPAQNALRFAMALADHRVPYELHVFERGLHGLSLADATTTDDPNLMNAEAETWIDLAFRWLTRQHERPAPVLNAGVHASSSSS